MASLALGERTSPPAIVHPPRERTTSWPLVDRACYGLCWATGIGLCLIAAAILLLMLVEGISDLRLNLLFESPLPSLNQSQAGGFFDPIVGTFIVTAIGTAIAAPVGVALATWLSEYGRPAWLARAVESGVEMIAGTPSIVLAIFGLLLFARGFFAFLSQSAADGNVTGQSFLVAGTMMSLLALPLVVAATRESLAQLPLRLRESSYALGKTRATTIRRVLLPAIRPGIASGVVLGMGRIIGDTAIITILLGSSLKNQPASGTPIIGTLRGFGSTLTSYVYNNSPAGEGNAPQKAYAAAFVLLMIVLALNALVVRLTRGVEPSAAALARRRRVFSRLSGLPWNR
ncbi:MAG TPA: ABC transporter permease subunit [Solirubrobacteraceae bacterium]|nr:ABC transporter permease subunit [Solirubrobacteraceae bacterium]